MASHVPTIGVECDPSRKVRELERELTEARAQQAATAGILALISSSPADLRGVFAEIAASAARLCEAYDASIFKVDGDALRLVAHHWSIPPMPVERNVLPLIRGVLTGRAVLERRTIQIEDLQAESDEYPEGSALARSLGHRTILVVPLIHAGEALGVIVIRRTEVKPFGDNQIALLQTFADQAVIAIENTRLFEEVQTRTAELQESLEQQTATSQVLSVISSSAGQLEPVFKTMLQNAVRICGAKFGNLWLREGDRFRIAATHGAPPAYREYFQREPVVEPHPKSGLGQILRTKQPIHIEDIAAAPGFKDKMRLATIELAKARSLVGVPMLKDAEVVGCIAIYRQEVRPFTEKQVELVANFASQAVIAIENTRLLNELRESLQQQIATADVLKVISRSAFELQPVLDALVETAAKLCAGDDASIFRLEGDVLVRVAHCGQMMAPAGYRIPAMSGTVIGRSVLERRPISVANLQTETEDYPEGSAIAKELGHRAIFAVPLLRQGAPLGAISLRRNRAEPFSDKQIELVTTFADQAVIAIENTRLFEEVRARTHDLQESLEYQTATGDVLGVISRSPTDVQPVFDTIARSAAQLCGAPVCNVFRFDGQLIHIAASHSPPSHGVSPEAQRVNATQPSILPGRGSAAARAIATKAIAEIPDIDTDPEYRLGDVARTARLGSTMAVPMLKDSRPIGAIALGRFERGHFPQRQIELLRTFADQAVIAIENARLFEEIQERTRELTEAFEQQTATSDILHVIAGTPDDAQPVFNAIAQSALRLFGVSHVAIMLREGDWVRSKATAGSADPRGDFLIPLERNSTSGRAILDRAVISVGDTEAADAPSFARESGRLVGFRAMAAAPMMREGMAIGSVHIMRQTPGPFTNTQIELLKTFADQAVIAIENARLFDQVQLRTRELGRSVEELQALREVGRAVSSTLDLKAVLKTIVERAVQLSGTDAGSIFYYRKELGTFELGETTGLSEEFVAQLRKLEISAKETGPGEAIAKRQPLQVPDLMQRPSEPLRDAVLEAGFRASLLVPLLSADEPLGTLILRRRQPGEFPATVVSLMQSFADQSAIALENARLFEEIAQKSRELEITSQHKSQFVANMSHELRTPLAAILGYAELMQEGFYEPLGQKSLDALTRIRSNGKHLLGLINTVLDIAKIESGQFSLNLAEYAMESVVETVRAATESLAETKKLALKTDVTKKLPVGLGDEQRLMQVLLNLVGNAIKFTDTGEVRIAATAVDGHFAVSVTDTGPGIPDDHQARIFEQFHQVDSSNTKAKGGTGLGLAIAKQIVEMHGGRIWVKSTLGKGATFQMDLPIRVAMTGSA
jgi:GAF domain-containing protein